jgi:hypothetical protein
VTPPPPLFTRWVPGILPPRLTSSRAVTSSSPSRC